ncbi:MAG: hypothetical protein QUS11_08345 [Candidatus Fermentibacter sp.]|nr:hypothetical protein [Candidatus Fermentibacter sp.]
MSTVLAILTGALIASGNNGGPIYTLEYPGFVFEWLPGSMNPPVEGSIDEESGAVAASPSAEGFDLRIHYWRESIPMEDRAQWLTGRVMSELSPEALEMLLMGEVSWLEGSMESSERTGGSVGLVVAVNFNIITENGSVRGRGRAYGVFTDEYSLLVYGLAPFETCGTIGSTVDSIISHMHV